MPQLPRIINPSTNGTTPNLLSPLENSTPSQLPPEKGNSTYVEAPDSQFQLSEVKTLVGKRLILARREYPGVFQDRPEGYKDFGLSNLNSVRLLVLPESPPTDSPLKMTTLAYARIGNAHLDGWKQLIQLSRHDGDKFHIMTDDAPLALGSYLLQGMKMIRQRYGIDVITTQKGRDSSNRLRTGYRINPEVLPLIEDRMYRLKRTHVGPFKLVPEQSQKEQDLPTYEIVP